MLAAVLALAPLLGYLPMASLAALLLLVAWNMSEAKHFVHTLRVAPRSDMAVLVACFLLTVFFDMVVGVSVGMVLAALLFMRRMADVTEATLSVGSHPDLPGPIPAGVVVYDISGALFFGAAQKAMGVLRTIGDQAHAVVLRMDQVPAMDATGLVALESAIELLARQHCVAIVTGLKPQPRALLEKARFVERNDAVICDDISEAMQLADLARTPRAAEG